MDDASDWFARTSALLGQECSARIRTARVAVFGVGGVGSFACEALARAGVGAFLLVDRDIVEMTNRNRQLVALTSTVGKAKTAVMAARLRDINPNVIVAERTEFYAPETADTFELSGFNVVVDAIDSVPAKVELLARCVSAGVPVVTSAGAANRIDPSQFRICDLMKTQGDGLARAVRRGLRARGLAVHAPCVVSDETAVSSKSLGSLVTVTATAGLLLAHAALTVLMKEGADETNNT